MHAMPSLMLHPDFSASEYVSVTPERAGWEHLHFEQEALNFVAAGGGF